VNSHVGPGARRLTRRDSRTHLSQGSRARTSILTVKGGIDLGCVTGEVAD
jgi:hypothetical protein